MGSREATFITGAVDGEMFLVKWFKSGTKSLNIFLPTDIPDVVIGKIRMQSGTVPVTIDGLWIEIDTGSLNLFDPKTGNNLSAS